MPCNPGDQLYDCQRPPGTNRQVFHARDGMITEVTSNGLEEGQEIPILVRDETGEYVPYEIDGQPVVLTADNPSVLIDEEGWYQLDTSEIECPEDSTITVETNEQPVDVSTSSIACFTDEEGESRYVEIVRYSGGQDPVIYEIGTGVRIVNPVGTFTENCCDCENGGGVDNGPVPTSQILCNPDGAQVVAVITVDTETGVPNTEFYNLDGTPYEGDTSELSVCEGTSLESDPRTMCDGGTDSFIRWFILENGEPTGDTFDTDVNGQPYTVQGDVTLGFCDTNEAYVETNPLCVLNDDTNEVIQEILQEIVYDSEGNRVTSRFVDRVTGDPVSFPGGTHIGTCPSYEESEPCVSCETLIMCDQVNDPDPTAGIPWNVVEIEEDADDPEHILHYHMSPADDPTKVGVVTFQSSTPFNTGGCEFPDVDYAISNPSRRTITLDEVAQEMHAFQFNMIDFDTFEPTYIPTGFPIPTRLGGTAYWTGEPGNNVNILPTESDGTGLLIWDNPPETLAIQVGNTGGGNSCSNVDFEALTLSTMNRSFLRTICRDCEGNIVSVSDYEMDGVTPYEPVGEVTVCLGSAESSSDEQPQPPEEVWTEGTRSLLHDLAVNIVDTLPGGASYVQIQNVGEANGTVMGAQLKPNDIFEVHAYSDPVSKEFIKIPPVNYDSTGTAFRITRFG